MADGGGAKCSAAVGEGAYFMASIMAITGIMATVLVLSGLFQSALRRLGQPSIISHILVCNAMHAHVSTSGWPCIYILMIKNRPASAARRPASWLARRCSAAPWTSGS